MENKWLFVMKGLEKAAIMKDLNATAKKVFFLLEGGEKSFEDIQSVTELC